MYNHRAWAGTMPNRVEREIEEILSKMDGDPRGREPLRFRRSWRSRLRRTFSRIPIPRLPRSLNGGTMILWGIGLLLFAMLFRIVAPSLTIWVVIVGLVLFLGGFVVGFLHKDAGSIGGGDAYWRGERFSRSDLRGPSSLDRLRVWWRDRNRRR